MSKQRHYHKIELDGVEPDMFSEIFHDHYFKEVGHTHEVVISTAYVKVDTTI